MEQEAKLRYSKRLRSGTRRRYQDDGISDDEIEGKRTFDLEDKLLSSNYSANFVRIMEGKDFSIEYIQREGLRTPLVFTNSEGLGLKMPGEDFSVNDVKYFVGSRRMIDVMDVTTQKGIEMSMAQWRRYYETPPEERDKLYNVISLEFSHTKLENLVQRPASVDKIDWVDNMWPRHLKERQRDSTNAIFDMKYPKVQKYCLMSVQGCYTDFHIDFGGTSVWYHVLKGGKVFWLIPPTPQNLELYENWVLSGKQGDIFLGDKAAECQRIQLKQGYTFMIPSGWIHAVYTPVDTIVFGGNFLHSFNIPMQLHIYNIEDRTRVPAKFRYPFYYEMCWYVLERYLYSMTKKSFLTVEFQRESLGIGLEPEVNGNLHNGDAFDDGEHEDKSPESGSPEDGGGGGGGGIKDESGNNWIHLTAFELEGLKNLVGKLESLPSNKKCIPAGIQNPDGLLIEMKKLLEEHSNDELELACTGIPIVKWPKRPLSYQPPTPIPVGRPKMNIYPTGSRPVRSNLGGGSRSSVSVLRRRRVRCRKCAACTRRECGECNFCRDMKKNGGPGRLKQSCVLRQCLSPGLPLSAVCAACNEGTQDPEEATDLSLTLMECSSCSEIMHPKCIDVPGEGEINKDLLNCWVCPKCVLARREESQTESEEDSASPASPASADLSASTIDYDKRGLRGSSSESRVGGKLTASHADGRRRHLLHNAINQNPSSAAGQRHRRLTPAQQQYQEYLQQRKRKLHTTTSLELRHKKKMKLEREKLFLQARRKAYEVGSRYSRLKILRPLRSREDSSGTASSSLGGSAISRTRMNSSSSKRGRGMSTRSCDRGKNEGVSRYPTKASSARMDSRENLSLRSARFRRRQEQLQSSVPTGATGVPNKQGQVIIQGKENRPNQTQGMSADEECLDSDGDMSTEPTVVIADLGEELERARLKGSYLTVTLQRPPKAFNGSSIVPKLQAIPHCPSSTQGSLRKHPRVIPRLEADNEMDDVQDQDSETYCTGSALNGSPPGASNGGIAMKGISLSSRGIIDDCRDPTMQKEIWMSVFRYLTRKELCDCMAVCKTWYKWCCDKKLWMKIDLSRCRSISPQALSGIIKRQPIMLDLSWTNISKKQLAWLINRLPGLKDLILAGCTWSSISALSTSSCPLLRTLDLRWAEGVKDSQIRDLLTPPGADNRSKLRNMVSFRLAGLEITDATLRLIIRHMPLLARLDISHCTYVTDQSVNLLTAVGSSTRNSLTEINLAGCNKLTDQCLVFLKRISNVTLIDLRGCKGITRRACEQFISDLSINTLYCLSDEKLIQKIG